jgi:hypothetical protein
MGRSPSGISRKKWIWLMAVLVVVAAMPAALPVQAEGSLTLCGNTGPAPTPVQHVIVVMMENLSYKQVVGSPNAPYQTALSGRCGNPQAFFNATHSSAANYLAVSAGQFPVASTPGCGSANGACASSFDTVYNQLDRAGLNWAGYIESMPSNCYPGNFGPVTNTHALYSVGHNPVPFFRSIPKAACQANDLAVSDLTAQSGPFWTALQNQTLPAFSWVTPNATNDNEGGANRVVGEQIGDAFLQRFMENLQRSNSYQAGNTLVIVTYDEGTGSDSKTGQDCTNKSLDLPVVNNLSAHQESCHIPTFVVYPYTSPGDPDPTFFTSYSITRTVDDLFGLPPLAHAGDAQTESLVGHFGIPPAGPVDPHPQVSITKPAGGSTASGTLTVAGTASSDADITQVEVSVDDGTPQVATGTTDWSLDLDTSALADGSHTISAKATDSTGDTGSASVIVTVQNGGPVSTCPPAPAGTAELSANLSLESDGTGWMNPSSTNSLVSRTAPADGSFDGTWALRVAPKASGSAGVNNGKPFWVPGPPGPHTEIGTAYTGVAQVKAAFVGQKVSLLVREVTPGGAQVASRTTTLTLKDTSWHQISTGLTASGNDNSIRYSVYAAGFTNASQYFLADCLSLHTP